jgi:26S proteasome regulatory subunit N3
LTDFARATPAQRLGHNVLKTGLRKISLSYSRISMADIAAKLQLPSATAAEHVCAKAIRDGVIEATIDHANGWLLSNDVVDLYATEVPPAQPQE